MYIYIYFILYSHPTLHLTGYSEIVLKRTGNNVLDIHAEVVREAFASRFDGVQFSPPPPQTPQLCILLWCTGVFLGTLNVEAPMMPTKRRPSLGQLHAWCMRQTYSDCIHNMLTILDTKIYFIWYCIMYYNLIISIFLGFLKLIIAVFII